MSQDRLEAVLLVSFGGPEAPEDVTPFLEIVLAGRAATPERLREVAGHYHHFGGKSPINDQNRALAAALGSALRSRGHAVPVHIGNRNWHPFLDAAIAELGASGVKRAVTLYASPYGSYSSCRQYTENLRAARAAVGSPAPELVKSRAYFNHPGHISACAARTRDALAIAAEGSLLGNSFWSEWQLVFTAHSIPEAMAATGPYESQLLETSRLVAREVSAPEWTVAFQSRSGPPSQPWLGPEVGDVLDWAARDGRRGVVVCPIGFISDHMEVVYDLDVEAAERARELGLRMVRSTTVGTHPDFVAALADVVVEAANDEVPLCVGGMPAAPRICAESCCDYDPRRTSAIHRGQPT